LLLFSFQFAFRMIKIQRYFLFSHSRERTSSRSTIRDQNPEFVASQRKVSFPLDCPASVTSVQSDDMGRAMTDKEMHLYLLVWDPKNMQKYHHLDCKLESVAR
jgi:hypothetical protein